MELIRVLIADDDSDVRALVRTILTSSDDIAVVAEASTGPEAISAVDKHFPDVVLMDIRMPGDGLTAAEVIRRRHPTRAVVILTTFGEDSYIDRAVALGVSGFLLKTADPGELLRGVQAVAVGGACLSPGVAARVIRHAAQRTSSTERNRSIVERLSPRERKILAALAGGMSNAEIATAQHLTEGTVKGYVSALFLRLDVRNRVEAAIVAHEAGILENRLKAPD